MCCQSCQYDWRWLVQNAFLVVIVKIVIFDLNIGFLNTIFFMKYFMDIEILYEKFFLFTKYCPISNWNVNAVVIGMNNMKSSTDSDSSNEEYNINNNNNRYIILLIIVVSVIVKIRILILVIVIIIVSLLIIWWIGQLVKIMLISLIFWIMIV